jgi:hypothetical protein
MCLPIKATPFPPTTFDHVFTFAISKPSATYFAIIGVDKQLESTLMVILAIWVEPDASEKAVIFYFAAKP